MSDEITKEAYDELNNKFTALQTEHEGLNTKYTTLNGQFTEASTKLQGLDGITRESFDVMKTENEAFKKNGNPEDFKLENASLKNDFTTLQDKYKDLEGKAKDLASYKKGNIVGGKIQAAMNERLGADAAQYTGVAKMFVNEFELVDNEPRTKEGFTIAQFLENKSKTDGWKFLQGRTNTGAGKTHGEGGNVNGGTAKDIYMKYLKESEKRDLTIKEQQEMAIAAKQMKADIK